MVISPVIKGEFLYLLSLELIKSAIKRYRTIFNLHIDLSSQEVHRDGCSF